MQGERGSLRDLQRYHRGGDGTRRRITIGNKKDQIIEEDEVDGNRISESNAEQDSISVQKIPKTNLGCKSPKSAPRGRRSDHDNLIKEEDALEKGNKKSRDQIYVIFSNNLKILNLKTKIFYILRRVHKSNIGRESRR